MSGKNYESNRSPSCQEVFDAETNNLNQSFVSCQAHAVNCPNFES